LTPAVIGNLRRRFRDFSMRKNQGHTHIGAIKAHGMRVIP
jgi:hypothetical protein